MGFLEHKPVGGPVTLLGGQAVGQADKPDDDRNSSGERRAMIFSLVPRNFASHRADQVPPSAGGHAELLLSSGGLIEQGAIARTFNPTKSTDPNSTTSMSGRNGERVRRSTGKRLHCGTKSATQNRQIPGLRNCASFDFSALRLFVGFDECGSRKRRNSPFFDFACRHNNL